MDPLTTFHLQTPTFTNYGEDSKQSLSTAVCSSGTQSSTATDHTVMFSQPFRLIATSTSNNDDYKDCDWDHCLSTKLVTKEAALLIVDFVQEGSAINTSQTNVNVTRTMKPPLESVTLPQWISANSRIMASLIERGQLGGQAVLDYLAYTTRIGELATKFTWLSVLQYDDKFRTKQATSNFRWCSQPGDLLVELKELDKTGVQALDNVAVPSPLDDSSDDSYACSIPKEHYSKHLLNSCRITGFDSNEQQVASPSASLQLEDSLKTEIGQQDSSLRKEDISKPQKLQTRPKKCAGLEKHRQISSKHPQDEVNTAEKTMDPAFLNQREKVPSNRKDLRCDVCDRGFVNACSLQQHRLTHLNHKLFQCEVCNKKIRNAGNLKQHRLSHSREPVHECDTCQEKFLRVTDLDHHRFVQHRSLDHSCDICNKKFAKATYLDTHRRRHFSLKTFMCDVCSKSFAEAAQLKRHWNYTHSNYKNYVCDKCKKAFARPDVLRKHLLTHSQSRPRNHVCSVCSKAFEGAYYLKLHMRFHTGEKPHVCPICSKAFFLLSNLKRHLQDHSRENIFICDICQKEFYCNRNLQQHKLLHAGQTDHICPLCGKGFVLALRLKKHILVAHSDQKNHVCGVCGKAFKTAGHLKCHMAVHSEGEPYVCDVCQRTFKHYNSLRKHKLRKHKE